MFESAELGHRLSKTQFAREVPELRDALLTAQYTLAERKCCPVLVVVGGVAAAGRGEMVNELLTWMDPRLIQTHAFAERSNDERERPPMWRYWRALPAKGSIGIFFGAWYDEVTEIRGAGRVKARHLDERLDEITRFERMLSDEGALLLKFWIHLSESAQRQRLKMLDRNSNTRWRVTPADWLHLKHYARYRARTEHVLRVTSSAEAPWIVVEGTDARYRDLTVGRMLAAALNDRLADKPPTQLPDKTPPLLPTLDRRTVLSSLDLQQALPKQKYEKALEKWQGRLSRLARTLGAHKRSAVVLFEGHDAAGKGGCIRRITAALDARYFRVIPIAAPTDEERAQPYLWRFWRNVPGHARIAIFDRSWYGRILVERVEGYCSEADWMRAYSEINDFEAQLVGSGAILLKFWLAVSKDEQLRRFNSRARISFKRYKLGPDDWRNRRKWDVYENAVCDMVDRTGTAIAPWSLVEANDKNFARVKVLKTLCERIESAL